jgi:hypothetical protein
MSLNPQQEKILTAFVTALAQQDDSLPSALQKQLNAYRSELGRSGCGTTYHRSQPAKFKSGLPGSSI